MTRQRVTVYRNGRPVRTVKAVVGKPSTPTPRGTLNVGGVLGSAVSHGCVRLANATMRWLVLRIGPGVPVTITA